MRELFYSFLDFKIFGVSALNVVLGCLIIFATTVFILNGRDSAEVKVIVAYLDVHTPGMRKARLRKYAETLVQMVSEEK